MARVVKTRVEVEGRVTEETVVVDRDEPQVWEEGRDFAVVGRPANRVDGRERVTGAARYTYDIYPPGVLHAAVLRSPHPHARIVKLDTAKAERLPGVRAVLSSEDAPDISWFGGATRLFDRTLRFVGDEVAAVVADDLDTARDALRLIEVEYETLHFVVDLEEALKPGAPQIHPDGNVLKEKDGSEGELYTRGDIDKGFKSADVIVEATYRTPTALHNSFETHGSVAMWEGEDLTLWESTQYIFGTRSRVASVLKMPVSKVRVISEYMGGGFGSKGGTGKQAVIAALLARAAGRPCKLMLNRQEENLLAGNRGATVQKVKIGAKKNGSLVAIDVVALYGCGAYGSWAGTVTGPAKELYQCPNVRAHLIGVRSNLGTHAAFRAPGFVEGTFALESAIDELCEKLGMDPLEFRRKNHAAKDQTSGQEYTSKHLLECYDKAAEMLSLDGKAPLPKKESIGGQGAWRRGIGMASQTWSGGGGPPAHAVVRLNSDGNVEVLTGTQDIGTGTKTALSQIVAEEMGVPLDSVRLRLGDTQKGPYAPASWGSITVPSMGPAVRAAAEDAKRQLLDVASYFFEVPAKRLTISNGEISIEGRKEGKRTIADLLSEVGDYMIMGKGFRGPNPVEPLRTWGAQFAEVEVNVETGQVRVLRVAAAHDVGRVINPKGLSSQFYGGILQGMGYGLLEERVVDGRDGVVLNPNLQDYKVPTLADTPQMTACGIDIPDTAANHVGSKGAGEPPIIPTAAAIANAIFNAVGVRVRELPITRRRMLEALDKTEVNGEEQQDG
ncbi:MAG TPA: xanthine dehydrogenase family protein molybdopterin-binding subunit [Chloroflexia bacterium]|jgi:xanthine dehydrogenase YagR molybdenum-binding subunit